MSLYIPDSADYAYTRDQARFDHEDEAECEDCGDELSVDRAMRDGRMTKTGYVCVECAREREIEQ